MEWKSLSTIREFFTNLPELNLSDLSLWFFIVPLLCYYLLYTLVQIIIAKVFEKIFYWTYSSVIVIIRLTCKLLPIVVIFILLRIMETRYMGFLSQMLTWEFVHKQYTQTQYMIYNCTVVAKQSIITIFNQASGFTR